MIQFRPNRMDLSNLNCLERAHKRSEGEMILKKFQWRTFTKQLFQSYQDFHFGLFTLLQK